MENTLSFDSLLWIETLLIILTRSLGLKVIRKSMNSHVRDLVAILEPSLPSALGDPSMTTNELIRKVLIITNQENLALVQGMRDLQASFILKAT